MSINKAAQAKLNTAARHGATALLAEAEKIAPGEVTRLLAQQVVDLRRSDVAVLGDAEAFVRRTDDGSLKQVIRPVRLSVAKGDLFQIPKRVPVDVATGEVVADIKKHRGPVRWEARPIDPRRAALTVQGMQAINAVAGVVVATPPTVMVDGVVRSNPYTERAAGRNGRPGDIVRIVQSCVVIGPVPATGNPVAVNYTLEYSPERELLAMAANLLARQKDGESHIRLTTDVAFEAGNVPNWVFIPMYGGLGYAVNFKAKAVSDMYGDFVNMLTNSGKKAQTVAMRNAMRRHPALGAFQSVAVGDNGEAVVAVVGWAGSGDTLRRYQSLAGHIGAGASIGDLQRAGLLISVDEIGEKFDPEAEVSRDLDVIDVEVGETAPMIQAGPDLRDALIGDLYALAGEYPAAIAQLDINVDSVALGDIRNLQGAISAIRDLLAEESERLIEAETGGTETGGAEASGARSNDDEDYGGDDGGEA